MLALATGCVVNSESTVPPGDRVTVEKVDAIANRLPPDIADGGTLEVGVNVPYAPNEF
ncbi:putative amino acid ABC transporter amino acid-binding protein [Rhodococcus rhodochrous]|nr:putative amino acid ABC transporter amino acid-binding protein [Rhodococcus rhodochrous]